MANPQIENGHVDIANEIVEALAAIRISGEEWQCLLVIMRKTYGWHKKEDAISLSQFVELTGLKKPNVIRATRKLLSKKIISIINIDNAPSQVYKINKDYDKWLPLSKKITLSKKIIGVIKKDNPSLSKMIPTKETTTKETITKERHFSFVFLFNEEYQKLVEKFGKDKTDEMIERLDLYLGSRGSRKYKSHYYTLLNWDRMERDRKPKEHSPLGSYFDD